MGTLSRIEVFTQDQYVATVEPIYSGEGYTLEWWITAKGARSIYCVAHLSLPVYGENHEEVLKHVNRLGPQIIHLVDEAFGGMGVPYGRPMSIWHATVHKNMHEKAGHLDGLDVVQRTAALYEMLSGLRVPAPAHLIAKWEDAPVRTIQDRIARARKLNLVPSYGVGRSHN